MLMLHLNCDLSHLPEVIWQLTLINTGKWPSGILLPVAYALVRGCSHLRMSFTLWVHWTWFDGFFCCSPFLVGVWWQLRKKMISSLCSSVLKSYRCMKTQVWKGGIDPFYSSLGPHGNQVAVSVAQSSWECHIFIWQLSQKVQHWTMRSLESCVTSKAHVPMSGELVNPQQHLFYNTYIISKIILWILYVCIVLVIQMSLQSCFAADYSDLFDVCWCIDMNSKQLQVPSISQYQVCPIQLLLQGLAHPTCNPVHQAKSVHKTYAILLNISPLDH